MKGSSPSDPYQELNPSGSPVNLGLPSQIVLADSLLEDLNVGKVEDKSTLGGLGTISLMPLNDREYRGLSSVGLHISTYDGWE